ncbi:hypothetical protein TNCV_1596821 [Trichonephila clavipes]|nr:hypothetical protein TNCV_1596821 [Trichonephila clavipes]
MKRKENFQWLPKELHQLKYEAISVPQGSVRLVKKTQERKSSTCYLLITKVPSSPCDFNIGGEENVEHVLLLCSKFVRERTVLRLVFKEHINWPPNIHQFISTRSASKKFYEFVGYVKSLVYADKPQTLDHLEDNIRRVIADIRPQMLEKIIDNWTSRLDYIQFSRGSPMP